MKVKSHVLVANICLLVAIFFLFERLSEDTSRSLNPGTQSQPKLTNNDETPADRPVTELSAVDQIRARLVAAQSLEEFLKILEESLHDDEFNTIQALAGLRSQYLEDSYPVTTLFRDYFSERYTALEAIGRLSALEEPWYNIYKMTAIDLLAWHANRDDPVALLDYLNDPAHYDISSVVPGSLAVHIARQDLQKAVELIDFIQDPDMQAGFREEVFNEWVAVDPGAVTDYLNTIERGPEHDVAIQSLADILDHRYHDVAMSWADAITDPELRQETYQKTAQAWYLIPDSENREQYEAWKSTVSDPELLNQLAQQEADHNARREIKFTFSESVDRIRDEALLVGAGSGSQETLDVELNEFASFSSDIIEQANQNPEDFLLNQEAYIMRKRIAEDFSYLGELHPTFKEIIVEFHAEQQRQIEQESPELFADDAH